MLLHTPKQTSARPVSMPKQWTIFEVYLSQNIYSPLKSDRHQSHIQNQMLCFLKYHITLAVAEIEQQSLDLRQTQQHEIFQQSTELINNWTKLVIQKNPTSLHD